MPRPRKQDAQDTRELALAAADRLLHEHGYLGVSMDAVAEAAGVRKASLYHHFPEGKEQLVLEIAERAIRHDAQGIERAVETGATAQERLRNVAAFVFRERRRTDRVLQDAARFMPAEHGRHVYGLFLDHHFTPVRAVLEDGVASGELRPHDTERGAWAFLGLVSEMNMLPDDNRDDLAEFVAGLFVNGTGR